MEKKEKYKFLLFTSGMSVKSVRALENFKNITDKHLRDRFELEVIDISRHKEKAIEYQIFALPTLIKISPAPVRTILGDLSDNDKILKILDLV